MKRPVEGISVVMEAISALAGAGSAVEAVGVRELHLSGAVAVLRI
ncbi:hypothetical protein GCM10023220_01020 [Streptomyces ziwulingensis]|uniref:Gas vesicle protein n=1 Tax=Streptomyces ziwulingensis TaxID=1045501 RepID=A0ABP9AJ83_9ACTN